MTLLVQVTQLRNETTFDPDIVLRTITEIGVWTLSRVPYLVIALCVFLGFIVTGRILKRLLLTTGRRTRLDATLAELLGRLLSFAITLLGLFVAAVIIFPTFQPGDLIAGLGITSVAIGFAFKDVLQNFFAGILILWRQPFIVGDQIRVKEYEGTVEEITVRSTRLKTHDGTRAVIPNGDVYTSPVLVLTAYDRRRIRISVGISYSDSIEEARDAINQVVAETDGVLDEPAPVALAKELAPSSVNFDVYFWVRPRQVNVLRVIDSVISGIKLALQDAKIEIPYPHQVVLLRDSPAISGSDGAGSLANDLRAR